jgi:transposase
MDYSNDERVNCFARLAVDALIKVLKEIYEMEKQLQNEIHKISKTNDKACQLRTIPGIGEIGSTALLTVSGDPHVFKNGRAFSASIGLVPKKNETEENGKRLGISKQGNKYVRHILVLCARSLITKANRVVVSKTTGKIGYKSTDKMSLWIRKLLARNVHTNKVCIAIANKLARISYRILVGDDKVKYDANLSNG